MARPVFKPVFTETESAIRDRMLNGIPDDWRKEPGDFMYDAVAPAAPEILQAQINQDAILRGSFALYAEGDMLDLKLEEIGLSRIQAVAAKRKISVTADAGVVIPADHTVSTVVLDGGGNPIAFTTDNATTFAVSGTKDIIITCEMPGIIGNVPPGSQFIILPPIPGVRAVVDSGVVVLPGSDKESDQSAWERYDFKVKHPDTGGNKNDYIRWAQEVDGVGKSKIVPRWLGNGTVKVILAGTDAAPATQEVVDNAQSYLDPKLDATLEAEAMTISGYGASVDETQVDDNGTSVKMTYSATGAGILTYGFGSVLEALVETENHFIARPRVKVSSIAGANNLLQVTVQDRGTKVPLKQVKGGGTDARLTLKANQLAVAFGYVDLPFYWDGLQTIEFEIRRLTTDATTQVWVDAIDFTGLYGQGLGNGKAPGGARVTVVAATPLAINVATTLTLEYGADPNVVEAEFTDALADYLKTLVFVPNAQVIYARIGGLLITTPGVINYTSLTVNGGAVDVPIGAEEVPVVGTVTL